MRERASGQERDRDGESHKERVDRELIELLNELRVALPGVQVLFAFLFTVPFSSGFERMTDMQRWWYFATLLVTAVVVGVPDGADVVSPAHVP